MTTTGLTAGSAVPARDPGLDGVVPFRFACHRCGHCCSGGSGYVWLEESELDGLAAAAGSTRESFVRRHVRVARDPRTGRERLALTEIEAAGGRCSLLVGRNTCGVYAARPAHCREFPYWDSVLNDRDGFEAARATCPGIAVVVAPDVRERAFAELAALHARCTPRTDRSGCCLDARSLPSDGEPRAVTYASALEVDWALTASASDECRFGARAPLACRFADDGEALRREVRAIERRTGYPAAYGELTGLIAARTAATEETS